MGADRNDVRWRDGSDRWRTTWPKAAAGPIHTIWPQYLEKQGVQFHTSCRVTEIQVDGRRVTGAIINDAPVAADFHIAALPVEVMETLVTDDLKHAAPSIAGLNQLKTCWMNGIQFYLARDEPIVNGHAIYLDSPSGPGWLNSDRYDIYGRSAPGAASDIAETRLKLQTLLAQRFQLKAHRETRELSIYALVVARGGSKLSETGSAGEGSIAGIHAECGRMTGTMTSTKNLAVYLERQLARPVVDRTGLTDKYSFQFTWAPDTGPTCSVPAVDADGQRAAGDLSGGPSLFTALQESLGLKLDPTRGPVEVIVVDQAEKADAN